MRVLHINTSDIIGGAARGAYWCHRGLRDVGVDSRFLVALKSSDDPTVYGPRATLPNQMLLRVKDKIDLLPLQRYRERVSARFSLNWIPSNTYRVARHLNPDIINLHWVGRGLVRPENLPKFGHPIVWTLRDMWPFTGGCHNTVDCRRYEDTCGQCPHLGSIRQRDLSHRVWLRKDRAWHEHRFTVVAISSWLAECAEKSSLFRDKRIEVIHNALDETVFKPLPKTFARHALGLSQTRKLILFGAINAVNDSNKGFKYFLSALQQLSREGHNAQFGAVIFGIFEPVTVPDMGMDATYLGRLHDDTSLVLAYSAADVMVVPSLQEAFGKTAMEAMACGTPVVSFDTSGLKDIVEHKRCGYRASCFDADDLARGIAWVLEDDDRWLRLSQRARQKVEEEFTLTRQVQRYIKLYEEILSPT